MSMRTTSSDPLKEIAILSYSSSAFLRTIRGFLLASSACNWLKLEAGILMRDYVCEK